MALRWFLQAVSTQMVEHSNGGFPKEAKDVRMVGVREVEGMKAKSGRFSSGKVNGGKREGGNDYSGFQMPLHYPRYKKEEYETMEEWKVDLVLKEYGLACDGTLEEKRAYAIGAFLWPDQL